MDEKDKKKLMTTAKGNIDRAKFTVKEVSVVLNVISRNPTAEVKAEKRTFEYNNISGDSVYVIENDEGDSRMRCVISGDFWQQCSCRDRSQEKEERVRT